MAVKICVYCTDYRGWVFRNDPSQHEDDCIFKFRGRHRISSDNCSANIAGHYPDTNIFVILMNAQFEPELARYAERRSSKLYHYDLTVQIDACRFIHGDNCSACYHVVIRGHPVVQQHSSAVIEQGDPQLM